MKPIEWNDFCKLTIFKHLAILSYTSYTHMTLKTYGTNAFKSVCIQFHSCSCYHRAAYFPISYQDQLQQKIVCPGIVTCLAASPNGLFLLAGIAEAVYVWEVRSVCRPGSIQHTMLHSLSSDTWYQRKGGNGEKVITENAINNVSQCSVDKM